ncbi:MAG: T9SS type A sorting domain-containing protein [Bacteroidota bacterium]
MKLDSYEINNSRFVSLKVYNTLGQEVAGLVKREHIAGSYNVEFNAKDLSSGVYYYKIIVDGFVETKKMLLLR